MRDFIAVAIGGMVGSVSRHGVNLLLSRFSGQSGWPLATLTVNVVGCFAIGLLSVFAKRYGWVDTEWELAVRVGILGGLTTFSSFGLEVVRLWQEGRFAVSAAVICLNVFLGIGAVVLGAKLGEGL